MSTFTNIQIALESRLSTLTDAPEIAWNNVPYKPEKGVPHLRPTNMPSASDLLTLNEYNRYQGLYQIDIFVPADRGTKDLYTIADNINDHFLGETLTANGDTVFVQNISISAARKEEAWYTCYVEINYLCFS